MKPAYAGEVCLARWSDSPTGGATITFWLPDPEDLNIFRGMTLRKGGHAGQRFACVLVEISDQEELIDGELPLPPTTNTAQELADGVEVLPSPGEGKAWLRQADGSMAAVDVTVGAQKALAVPANAEPDKALSEVPSGIKPATHRFPNGLVGLSVRWCSLPDHWNWLEQEFGIPCSDERTAKDLICSITGVESRKEFETNPDAAATYVREIKEPYAASRKARGLDA